MERATRCGSGKAASIGLLTLGLTGCASVQNPPGGPPDFTPPTLLGITPDSGTINPEFRGEVKFQFDEVLNEGAGNTLASFFHLSPRPEDLRVRWHRKSIGVEPEGGWLPNTVYQLKLDSGLMDLRNNRFSEERTVIFTTGGEIPNTLLSGVVIDWEGGRPAVNAVIEAVHSGDSLIYTGRTDSVGEFSLSAVPIGEYTIFAVLDGNNNGMFDRRESFDSAVVSLDSIADGEFWVTPHDTVGPRITTLTPIDSTTFSIQFNQSLLPGFPSPSDVVVSLLPDSTLIQVASVQIKSVFDSLSARLRATADSLRRDSLAALDTTAVDSIPPNDTLPPRGDPPRRPGATPTDTTTSLEPADSTRAQRLLGTRPTLENSWVVVVTQPMPPGSRYVVTANPVNLIGATGETTSVLIVPEPPEPEPIDSTTVDSLALPADSLVVDSLQAAPVPVEPDSSS